MFSKHNKFMIEKNYIKINKFIISKNWYELINDSSKKKTLKELCKEKKTIIYLNKDSLLSKKQLIAFFKKEKIHISKIYHDRNLVLKTNNYKKPTSKLIFFLLIIINMYLHSLTIKNNKIKTHLSTHQTQLINQLSNLKSNTNRLKDAFNSTLSQLNHYQYIIESISIKTNTSVNLSIISLTNLASITHQLNTLTIKPKIITPIGGTYEIHFKY